MMDRCLMPIDYMDNPNGNTAIKATMYTLNTTLNTLLSQLDFMSAAEEEATYTKAMKFQEDFARMIINLDCPEKYFDFVGHGAYKECYETGIPGWVVKFAAVSNPTGAERQLLEAAKDYGVDRLFCASHYIDLPVYLDSRYLDCNECGECTWCNDDSDDRDPEYTEPMNVAILQPFVDQQDDTSYTYLSYVPEAYETNPVRYSSGAPVPLESISRLDISSHDWVQGIVDFYGDVMLSNFLMFSRDFTLNDLHDKNIGYIFNTKVPVLLDWMSFDARGLS